MKVLAIRYCWTLLYCYPRIFGHIFGVIMEIKTLTRCQIGKNIGEHQV